MGDSLGVTNQMGIAIQRGESDHINGFHQSTKFNLSASKRPMASAQVDITNFSDKTRSPNRQHEKSHQSSQSEEVITRGSSSDGQIGPRGLAGQNRELVWEKFGKRNLHSRRTGIVTRHDRHKGYPPSGQWWQPHCSLHYANIGIAEMTAIALLAICAKLLSQSVHVFGFWVLKQVGISLLVFSNISSSDSNA